MKLKESKSFIKEKHIKKIRWYAVIICNVASLMALYPPLVKWTFFAYMAYSGMIYWTSQRMNDVPMAVHGFIQFCIFFVIVVKMFFFGS